MITVFKRIKNCMRSTMSNERLSHLTILWLENDLLKTLKKTNTLILILNILKDIIGYIFQVKK